MVPSSYGSDTAMGYIGDSDRPMSAKRGVPVLLSSGFLYFFVAVDVVGGCCFQHCEDEVASAACDADNRSVVAFAFIAFPLVIGLGVRVVSSSDERSEEHRVFETVVAASTVERPFGRGPGFPVDGCESGV